MSKPTINPQWEGEVIMASDLEKNIAALAKEIAESFPELATNPDNAVELVKIIRYRMHCSLEECKCCDGTGRQSIVCSRCGGSGRTFTGR